MWRSRTSALAAFPDHHERERHDRYAGPRGGLVELALRDLRGHPLRVDEDAHRGTDRLDLLEASGGVGRLDPGPEAEVGVRHRAFGPAADEGRDLVVKAHEGVGAAAVEVDAADDA